MNGRPLALVLDVRFARVCVTALGRGSWIGSPATSRVRHRVQVTRAAPFPPPFSFPPTPLPSPPTPHPPRLPSPPPLPFPPTSPITRTIRCHVWSPLCLSSWRRRRRRRRLRDVAAGYEGRLVHRHCRGGHACGSCMFLDSRPGYGVGPCGCVTVSMAGCSAGSSLYCVALMSSAARRVSLAGT